MSSKYATRSPLGRLEKSKNKGYFSFIVIKLFGPKMNTKQHETLNFNFKISVLPVSVEPYLISDTCINLRTATYNC